MIHPGLGTFNTGGGLNTADISDTHTSIGPSLVATTGLNERKCHITANLVIHFHLHMDLHTFKWVFLMQRDYQSRYLLPILMCP